MRRRRRKNNDPKGKRRKEKEEGRWNEWRREIRENRTEMMIEK